MDDVEWWVVAGCDSERRSVNSMDDDGMFWDGDLAYIQILCYRAGSCVMAPTGGICATAHVQVDHCSGGDMEPFKFSFGVTEETSNTFDDTSQPVVTADVQFFVTLQEVKVCSCSEQQDIPVSELHHHHGALQVQDTECFPEKCNVQVGGGKEVLSLYKVNPATARARGTLLLHTCQG